MERDFEKEFRELKSMEAPDLWNRIEAGLSEKRMVNFAPEAGQGYGSKRGIKTVAWKKWGTLAAACLCVAVIYPMVSLVLQNMGNRDKNYSGSASEDEAMNNMAASEAVTEDVAAADDFATDEAADSATDKYVSAGDQGEESLENDGVTENAASEETVQETAQDMDAASSSQDELQSGTVADLAEEKGADSTDSLGEQEKKSGDTVYVLNDGQILEDVVISIVKADTAGDESLYHALVIQADADMLLEPQMQIEIVCDSETSYDFLREPREKYALKAEESYFVSLRYEKKENRFTVITAAKENTSE